jgi:hypothetical protein
MPHSLAAQAIEYRLEKSWGTGLMPGEDETGLVAYQLTEAIDD